MNSYSQAGQDIFVATILNKPGTFLDLGCSLPKKINNTMLLEELGWTGISVDIIDYSAEWEVRKTKFLRHDCLNIDLKKLLEENFNNEIIDYLTLDMEKIGDRFRLLEKAISTGFKFKVITIEHDAYINKSYEELERDKQRILLESLGYILICKDVSQKQFPTSYFEDWWINPEFIDFDSVKSWQSEKTSCDKIFEKIGIEYTIHPISQTW